MASRKLCVWGTKERRWKFFFQVEPPYCTREAIGRLNKRALFKLEPPFTPAPVQEQGYGTANLHRLVHWMTKT